MSVRWAGIALLVTVVVLTSCSSGVNSAPTGPRIDVTSSRASAAPETTSKISDAAIAKELRTVGVVVTAFTKLGEEDIEVNGEAGFDRISRSQLIVARAIDDWHSFADPIGPSDLVVPERLDGISSYSRALDAWYAQQEKGARIWRKCLDERERKPNPLGVEGCVVVDYDYDEDSRLFGEYVRALRALAQEVGLQ